MKRRQIYIASPLFNDRERDFNLALRDKLVGNFSVFLPQEDGLLLHKLVCGGVQVEHAERMVYDADISAISESEILLAVLDGAHIDEGVAFEVGFGKALGKVCVGLQTDVRRQLPTGNNPMLSQSLSMIFSDLDVLLSWLIQNYGHAKSKSNA